MRSPLRTPTALTFRLPRRRRPTRISNYCWLLASCTACEGLILPNLSCNFYLQEKERYHTSSSRLFSTANSGHRRVCVLQKDDNDIHQAAVAQHLADSLSLPSLPLADLPAHQMEESFTHLLCVESYPEEILPEKERYALAIQPLVASTGDSRKRKRSSKKNALSKIKPFWIELCPPTPDKRGGQPDLLLRAVAPKRVDGGAVVLDLTAGWAQDSLLLALGGASKVCMVERDPIVACLLKDALRRVKGIARSAAPISWKQRAIDLDAVLSLEVGDARQVLSQCEDPPDIVYLDPMFPPRTKTAAVKKGMQILHGLFETNQVTDDDDTTAQRDAEEAELLQVAYQNARVKVVVKRPINAPVLGSDGTDLKPSHTVKGSINRWDVYVKA